MVLGLVLLCYKQDRFTPRQAEALQLTLVEGLTQREAAVASRYQPCSRESYSKRLAAARRHAVTILRAEARLPQSDGIVRRPSEVRRGRNRGR